MSKTGVTRSGSLLPPIPISTQVPLQDLLDNLAQSIDDGESDSLIVTRAHGIVANFRLLSGSLMDLHSLLQPILRLCSASSSVDLRCAGLEILCCFLHQRGSQMPSIDRATAWRIIKDTGAGPCDSPTEWKLKTVAINALTFGGENIDGLRGLLLTIGGWASVAASWRTADTTVRLVESVPSRMAQADGVLTWCSEFIIFVLSHNAEYLSETDVDQVLATFDLIVVNALAKETNGALSVTAETSEVIGPPPTAIEIAARRRYPWTPHRLTDHGQSQITRPPISKLPPIPNIPLYDLPTRLYVQLAEAARTSAPTLRASTYRIMGTIMLLISHHPEDLPPIRLQKPPRTPGGPQVSPSFPPSEGQQASSPHLLQAALDLIWRLSQSPSYADITSRSLHRALLAYQSQSMDPSHSTENAISKQAFGAARIIRLALRRGASRRLALNWLTNGAASYAPSGSPTFLDEDVDVDDILRQASGKDLPGSIWDLEQVAELIPQAVNVWAQKLSAIAMIPTGNEQRVNAERLIEECLGIVGDVLEEARQMADGSTMTLGVVQGHVVGKVLSEVIKITELPIFPEIPILRLRSKAGTSPVKFLQSLNAILSSLLLTSSLRRDGPVSATLSTPAFATLPLTLSPSLASTLLSENCCMEDELLDELISYYVDKGGLSPTAPNWLETLRRLIKAVENSTPNALRSTPEPVTARTTLCNAISRLYDEIREVPVHRVTFLRSITLLCEEMLDAEQSDEVVQVLLAILATAFASLVLDESTNGCAGTESSLASRVRLVICRAAMSVCTERGTGSTPAATIPHQSTSEPILSPQTEVPSPTSKRASRSIFSTSPFQLLVNRASRSNLKNAGGADQPSSPMTANSPKTPNPTVTARDSSPDTARQAPSLQSVHQCKSRSATLALIRAHQDIVGLCPSSSLTKNSTMYQCTRTFQALLALFAPPSQTGSKTEELTTAPKTCRHARLMVAQWLLRLRADQNGQFHIRLSLDSDLEPYASLLGRSPGGMKTPPSEGVLSSSPRRRDFSPTSYKEVEPMWLVPETVPFDVQVSAWPFDSSPDPISTHSENLPIASYIRTIANVVQKEVDWDILSYVLCQLPLQLANKYLCLDQSDSTKAVIKLAETLLSCTYPEGVIVRLKKEQHPGALALVYHALTSLIGYKELFDRAMTEKMVEAFRTGLNKYPATIKPCLCALTLSAFELPTQFSRSLSSTVGQLSQIVTNPVVSVHILELVIILGLIPGMYANFREEDYKRVITVASRYIQHHNRAQRSDASSSTNGSHALSEHVLSISYYAIYTWVLALKRSERPKHITYVVKSLEEAQGKGQPKLDQRTEVCFDWLARYSSGTLDPRPPTSFLGDVLASGHNTSPEKTWIKGNAILTCRSIQKRDIIELECRRPSGMTRFPCHPSDLSQVTMIPAAELIDLLPSSPTGEPNVEGDAQVLDTVDGPVDLSRLELELSSRLDSTASNELTPAPPTEELKRTIRTLDRTPVLDSHTIAILYVGPGQTTEQQILSNRAGSPAYTRFLEGIGRLVRLKNQRNVYPGSLDTQNDMDGQFAYAWSSDIIQVLFHTTTLMPNHPGDAQYNGKKRHVGNDYIRIVWNDSGAPYRFNTLQTAFQFVNIVIEPHFVAPRVHQTASDRRSSDLFKITCQRAAGMPEFGPIGAFKLVTAENVPSYVREISLLADFFVPVWVHTQKDTKRIEYVTNWRRRLQAIKRLRESLLAASAPAPPAYHVLRD